MFNFFGAIPDILMGRNPVDALTGNALAVGGTLVGAPMLGSAGTGAAAAGAPAATNAAPGLLSTIGEYAKPIGQAASAASSVRGLLDPQQAPMQAPMPMQQMGGPQTLAMLAGQNQQTFENQLQMAAQERARRRQGFGGGLL